MPKAIATLLGAGALALAVAACGGSSSSSSSAAPASTTSSASAAATTSVAAGASRASNHLTIAANPTGMLMFDKSTLTAKAGKVTIAFTNKAPIAHNFTLESSSGQTIAATPTFNGATKTLTVTLKPGTYTFLCTVPGHEAAGMKGTLKVT